jgi:ABC-2 type transport system permease protein
MRTKALIIRICQQMLRDKRTLALLFVAPLLILTLMYFVFNASTIQPKLGVVNINKDLIQILKKEDISVIQYNSATNKTVVQDGLDGVLQLSNDKLILILQNSDPNTSKGLQMKISHAVASQIQAMQKSILSNLKKEDIDTIYIYGNKETSFFDVLSPILVGFFVFFFVFLISGIGLLRERTTGTLERLMSTPIRRGEVITGYLLGYGIFAVIQTIIVVVFAINVLNITLVGSIWNVILINLLLASVALSLGILLSTFAASEFQMMQFIPIVVIPQIFFAGLFPLEGMAGWLQALSKIMPLYYAANALKGIMYKGWGLSDIGGDIIALLIFVLLFIILNRLALKKYRKV